MVEILGPELRPSRLKCGKLNLIYLPNLRRFLFWWRWTGSNRWPPACKAGALPAELHPRVNLRFTMDRWQLKFQPSAFQPVSILNSQSKLVGLDGVEPSTSRLSGVRSNQAELQAPSISDLGMRIPDLSFLINSQIQNLKSKIRLSPSFFFKC